MEKPKFGVHVGIPEGTKIEELASFTEFIEDCGFDGVFVSDSFSTYHDPIPALATLAGLSKRLHLGTCVYILAQRHPLQVAKQTAYVQRISGGRLILGVGVGWRDKEFEGLNIPYKMRGLITDESIEIIKMAWDKGLLNFSGKWFKINEFEINAKLDVRPKIWIGGNSKPALTRSAKKGDGWIPTDFSASDYARYGPTLISELDKYGRDASNFVLASHLMVLTSNDDSKIGIIGERLANRFGSTIDEMKEWALVGSPSELVDRITQYSDAGITYHVMSIWGLPIEQAKETLEVFATKIIPAI
jgi:alkanesulfonate monooxygenase SsuD/methylene tetrahydromethanopterin reductase-like flavin-dependent oxidoreductase (luciferase family)